MPRLAAPQRLALLPRLPPLLCRGFSSSSPHPPLSASQCLPSGGLLVGRVWRPDKEGPSVVTVRGTDVVDITSKVHPTVSHLLEGVPELEAEAEGTAGWLASVLNSAAGNSWEVIGSTDELVGNSWEPTRDWKRPWLLAPVDLQAVKACGVTFARSMVERVIEERAGGDPARAADLRASLLEELGDIGSVVPGSDHAAQVKASLVARGMWSAYLEVGLGPDAEVFTKAQPMSAVGLGAEVGIHPASSWNNPEPEVVLVCNSRGRVVGATLGNDVNLRDVEGRSALLLGKAKDNNASCALGPFIRLLADDDAGAGVGPAMTAGEEAALASLEKWSPASYEQLMEDRKARVFGGGGVGAGTTSGAFTLDHLRSLDLDLTVKGLPPPAGDGFSLCETSSMGQISRDVLELVATHTHGDNHQYPDGFVLFTGTMFSPTADRGEAGSGFTHAVGDVVSISNPMLGALVNRVNTSDQCKPWVFGTGALLRNLAARGVTS